MACSTWSRRPAWKGEEQEKEEWHLYQGVEELVGEAGDVVEVEVGETTTSQEGA